MPPGGDVVFGQSDFGGGAGMDSDLGAEPRSAEGLGVGRPSMMRDRDSIDSRSVSIRSTSELTTSGLSEQKQLARAMKRERSELTITNRFAMVLNVI